MTAVQDLIVGGFREGNLIPIGTTPSAAELQEGLDVLNRYINGVFGFVLGEYLRDWQVPYDQRTGEGVDAAPPYLPGGERPIIVLNNQYPFQNARIVWDGTEQLVYFPQHPDDGARMAFVKASGAHGGTPGILTFDGNGRTIEGADTYISDGVTTTSRGWLYRADLANWMALTTLALTDTMPFPLDLDDLWVTAVAMRLAPRFSKATAPETLLTYKKMTTILKTRYTQTQPEQMGGEDLRGGYQSYVNTWRSDLL